MKLVDFVEELQTYNQEAEVLVEDVDGWMYDFYISDETSDGSKISLAPLRDTKRE